MLGEVIGGAVGLELGRILVLVLVVFLGRILAVEGVQRRGFLSDRAWYSDDGVLDPVRAKVLLHVELPLAPFAHGGVGAEQQQRHAREEKRNQRDNERQAPGLVGRMAMGDEGVEHRGHDEVSDAAAGVAPATREGVGGADDVLVEEAR